MTPHLRIARPVSDLERSASMYARGLGLLEVFRFMDHDGFDGVMLGYRGAGYHFELTHCAAHAIAPTPTAEDLVVLYFPNDAEWEARCAEMRAAGFREVQSFNPYWDRDGRTFEDPDGYRTVLQRATWPG